MTPKEQKENWIQVIERMKQTGRGRKDLIFAYLGLARAELQLKQEGN